MRKQLVLVAMGVVLAVALTGCGAGALKPTTAVAQAAEGFVATADVEGGGITLAIDSLQVGENRIVVTTANPDVTAVEAQVVMASMGHGSVVDLAATGPGRFEAVSGAMGMEGKWLVRVKATLPSGEVRTATFHLEIRP